MRVRYELNTNLMANTTLSESDRIALNEQLASANARFESALETLAIFSKEIDESANLDELTSAETHYNAALETVAEHSKQIQEITEKLGQFVEFDSQKATNITLTDKERLELEDQIALARVHVANMTKQLAEEQEILKRLETKLDTFLQSEIPGFSEPPCTQ